MDYWGFWVQDDYRLNTKLTLNFGLRYDYETGLHSSNNSLVEFDPNVVNPIQSQVSGITTKGEIGYAGTNGFTTATHPNSDKFGPRAGFAYAVNSKTSIRGGYGLLWAPFTFTLFTPIGYNNATPYVASTNNNVSPADTLLIRFPRDSYRRPVTPWDLPLDWAARHSPSTMATLTQLAFISFRWTFSGNWARALWSSLATPGRSLTI